MPAQEPIISVVCVFRNKKECIEPTLKRLYSIQNIPCEFIFIDDGSTDGSVDSIRSLVEHFQHSQTYFFEQEASRGRGNSINSALEHARGRFLWIPENVTGIDQEKLSEAVASLRNATAHVAIGMEEHPPENAMDWLLLLQNDRLPYDRDYLFDLRKIRANRIYTDPHWTSRHASEWAIRLLSDAQPLRVKQFTEGDNDLLSMDGRTKKECVFALLRVPELSLSGQEKAFRMLRTFGHTDLEEEAGSMEPLYQEAQTLYKSGNSVAALELLNRILAADPGHRKSHNFKVEILERLRRYVEAAELKHGYQSQHNAPRTAPDESPVDEPTSHEDSTDVASTDEESAIEVPPEEASLSEEPPSEALSTAGTKTGVSQEGALDDEVTDEEKQDESVSDEFPAGQSHDEEALNSESLETESPSRTGRFEKELREQQPLTIIIPTATFRRPMLEECLTSVFRYTARDKTRVIVVDNGSIDDTAEYLKSLLKENLPLTVLTNDQNPGFAAAINQGLAKAGDGYVVVMHNDVHLKSPVPARLTHILEKNPDIGLVAPRADRTWNPGQSIDKKTEYDTSGLTDVDYVDGYCMAFRNEPGLVLSKDYGLAYFEDADFCYRIQKKGYRIVIANREEVTHHFGTTTSDLGLTMRSKFYWQNASLFNREWHLEPQFPASRTNDDPLHQFVLLGELINPFFPEKNLLEYFQELFTSEQKTRVFHTEFQPDALKSMIRLMMATNQREILRRLEQQLDDLPPDMDLYHDLIVFYYDRTIYSRCKLYLKRLEETGLPVDLSLYHMKIALGEKDYERAALLLKELMDNIPTHPDVLVSAAAIHRRNGNHEQSDKFTALARTFNPYLKNIR